MDSTETIITEVCIGITGAVCDFVLPAHVPIGTLITDLVVLAEQAFPGLRMDTQNPMLLDAERTVPLCAQLTLAQAGIRDGSRLIFI